VGICHDKYVKVWRSHRRSTISDRVTLVQTENKAKPSASDVDGHPGHPVADPVTPGSYLGFLD
jgi:hypothetical protein